MRIFGRTESDLKRAQLNNLYALRKRITKIQGWTFASNAPYFAWYAVCHAEVTFVS